MLKNKEQKNSFITALAALLKSIVALYGNYEVSFIDVVQSTHFLITKKDGSRFDIINAMSKKEYQHYKDLTETWYK